jgi:hypothetical protein
MCVILNENISPEGTVLVALSKMINNEVIDFKAECRIAWQDNTDTYANARMLGLEFISMDYENSHNLERILTYNSASPQDVF